VRNHLIILLDMRIETYLERNLGDNIRYCALCRHIMAFAKYESADNVVYIITSMQQPTQQ